MDFLADYVSFISLLLTVTLGFFLFIVFLENKRLRKRVVDGLISYQTVTRQRDDLQRRYDSLQSSYDVLFYGKG